MIDNFGGAIVYRMLGFICIILIMVYKIINKKSASRQIEDRIEAIVFLAFAFLLIIFVFLKG
jgi:hypothetical protein